jgi:hypothetical protein
MFKVKLRHVRTKPFSTQQREAIMTKVFRGGILKTDVSRKKAGSSFRRTVALAATVTLLSQNFAWAVCSNGGNLPADGFVIGRDAIVSTAANFSPKVFTGTAGSIFIPDTSVNEQNDTAQPLTGGGHNWVFDQGSTLCKETDTGVDPVTGRATGWNIPPNTASDCVILPIIKGGRVTNLGDIPYQGQAVTPTCDPTKLSALGAPNAANSYFNQLGCSISHGVATDAQHATTYLFVAGIKGGLFSIALNNVLSTLKGADAGKINGPQNYYSDIPEGQKLTNAAVSPDGMFAMATSIRRAQFVYACLNPLGDPGDPSQPINTNFFVPPAALVKCMQTGNNNLAVDLTTSFGPDNQPYFGGQRIVNSYDSQPGSNALNPVPTAWPQCTFFGVGGLTGSLMDKMKLVFANHSASHCGNAQPNFGFSSALVTQPQALIGHQNANGDMYMYTGPLGGTVVQFKLKIDPASGLTNYAFRTYLTGVSLTTGLGIADDLTYSTLPASQGSLIVFTDPTAVGLAGQEVLTRLPLCEDMP